MNKQKKVNVIWNGKKMCQIYPHATKWEVFKFKFARFCRRCLYLAILIGIIFGIFKLGGVLNPSTIYTKQEVIKEVEVKAPVLERIAKCESKGNHYAPSGQVLVVGNENHSVDIGKYQINNAVWGAKATELGYNLMVEKDNEAFAKYLYKNYGTEPWVWTKKCWN